MCVCVLVMQVFALYSSPQSSLLVTLQSVTYVLFQLYSTVSQSASLLRYDFGQIIT